MAKPKLFLYFCAAVPTILCGAAIALIYPHVHGIHGMKLLFSIGFFVWAITGWLGYWFLEANYQSATLKVRDLVTGHADILPAYFIGQIGTALVHAPGYYVYIIISTVASLGMSLIYMYGEDPVVKLMLGSLAGTAVGMTANILQFKIEPGKTPANNKDKFLLLIFPGMLKLMALIVFFTRRKFSIVEPDPENEADRAKESEMIAVARELPIQVPVLLLFELKERTNNFGPEALLGKRSYGKVYHANLGDNQPMILRVSDAPFADSNVLFLTKVCSASKLKHTNLLKLLGYYLQMNKRILAYELAEMGSLHEVLHGKEVVEGEEPSRVLDWAQRLRIAVDSARGIEYLHKEARPTIVHTDIRSNNVFLFGDLKAKIAYMDTLSQSPKLKARLKVTGTLGYRAPELHRKTGQLTDKSDVYSFGVLLLEILSGRKPSNDMPSKKSSLVAWFLTKTDIIDIVDPKLEDEYPPIAAGEFAALATLCIQRDAKLRPDMGTIVRTLEAL